MNVKRGSIVLVKAGREKNSFMVVTDLAEKYVLLADGRERRLEQPKRKNTLHIQATTKCITMEGITNKKLKSVLREFLNGRTEEDETNV